MDGSGLIRIEGPGRLEGRGGERRLNPRPALRSVMGFSGSRRQVADGLGKCAQLA